MWLFLCLLICLSYAATAHPPAAVFEQSYDFPTPESYLAPGVEHQKNYEQYLRIQRQIKDLREPSLMESHMADYRQFHEEYQNAEESSTSSHRRFRRETEDHVEPQNRTAHSVREFIKFELSDAKVPDKDTELHIQKQRALKEGSPAPLPTPKSDRMTGSESQNVAVTLEARYENTRNGRSSGHYEQNYNQNSATRTPFKIVVPDHKPMYYKAYGSPSYNYPRYSPAGSDGKSAFYGDKVQASGGYHRKGKKLSDYPNKQWWLPEHKQRPQKQRMNQQSSHSEQYNDPNPAQYITLVQSDKLPTSYMMHQIQVSTPSPTKQKYAVIYKEVPVYYYTQTPKPITEDHAHYYVNPYGQRVKVDDLRLQPQGPDKHLGTKNEYVPILERKIPFKQQYAPETSTTASISALNALVGKQPLQQLQGLSDLLSQDRPQDSTSPVQFNIAATTQLPPVSSTQRPNVNIAFYQPQYQSYEEANPTSQLSPEQLNAVYNDLVQRHRTQEQRQIRPIGQRPSVPTPQAQYYQYTTPRPIQVSHASVTLKTPSESTIALQAAQPPPSSAYELPLSKGHIQYASAQPSSAASSTTYHGLTEDDHRQQQQQHLNHQKEPGYAFGYRVRDFHTGNDFGHTQNKQQNGITKGEYHILLPDGRVQTVRYRADDDGFHADVSYDTISN